MRFVLSHPFRRRTRNGWGTRALWRGKLWIGRGNCHGFKLCQQRRIDGAAVELREPQVAVEADAGDQGFAGCWVKSTRQRLLLHNQLPASGGWRDGLFQNFSVLGRFGLLQHRILARLLVRKFIQFHH